jgi:ABC-type glycerol-3-phosphate transport system substrate-binding protein
MKKTRIVAAIFGLMVAGLFAKESPNITVFRPGTNPRSKKDIMVQAAEKYTAKTGGKVTFVMGDWGSLESKLLTYMAAGTPIDVCFARNADFPKFFTKHYFEPINQYVNLDAKYLSKDAMDGCFKYEGSYYVASAKTSDHYWIILYNKSLMDEQGIAEKDQPLALWKAGKWDWDHLRSLALKLTKDTTGSGTIDRWGFGNWYTEVLLYANGVTLTNIDSKGKITLNMEDQRVTEALVYLQNAKNDGWYQQDNSIITDGLASRTVAMVMGREYDPPAVLKNTRDEIIYVPVPFGPSNKEHKNIYECDGYGIGAGSQNKKYAGIYIDCVVEATYENDTKDRAKVWPEEIFALGEQMEKSRWYPSYTTSPIESIVNSFLGEIVWSGNSPATAIASWEPKAVALVQDANKPVGKLERLPFKAVNEVFKNNKMLAAFKPMPDTEYSSVQISFEPKGIEAGSLKIACDYEVDGEDVAYCLTDPALLGIVGWRSYEVEFDIKALKEPGEEAYVSVQAYDNDLHKYGWTRKTIESKDEVYHMKATIMDVLQNGRIGLQISGHNMKDFLIDNIKIVEKID